MIGGLRREGFADPVTDADGIQHAAVLWNLVGLKAKNWEQLLKQHAGAYPMRDRESKPARES